MFRVTADSNIYVSALNFGGTPMRLLHLARARKVRLAISDEILFEVRRVLGEKFSWSEDRIDRAAARLPRFVVRVQPARRIDAIVDDPSDNRILECAVAAGSDFIVSGDRHLLRLRRFEGIEIVKVADFLRIQEGVGSAEGGGSAEGVGSAT